MIDLLVGNTPLIKLHNITNFCGIAGAIYAKLEFFNPAGSSKDRIVKKILDHGEKEGFLKKDSVIIEPTSGNTGIALAAIGANKGYKVILTMPETVSSERKSIISAYGAEIMLTPGEKGMKGAIEKAKSLVSNCKNTFELSQFDNPLNPLVHYETTGPEIFKQSYGNIDILIAGIGTGGTISGTGKYLKEKNPNISIIGVEPFSSPILSKGEKGIHKIQGIGAGFIPNTLDPKIYDEIVAVKDEEAFKMGKLLAKTEGFLVGISSGAALAATMNIAKRVENYEKNIVVIFPDGGDRYYSTPLFSHHHLDKKT